MNNILEYLEKTAQKYPCQVAVDDGDIALEWSQLVELSKGIGTALCKRTETGKPIAILMKKSAVTLAVMYGAVYAGCFYVMVDPSQPAARIQDMMQVLRPSLIVTNECCTNLLREAGCGDRQCLTTELLKEHPQEDRLSQIRQKSGRTDLLYAVFTSGSTGTPKGIVVNHGAVIDFITHFVNTFAFTSRDTIGNQAPFDFDVSVKDIYTSAFTGASLILIPKELFSTPPRLLDFLTEKKITTLIWAVSALCIVSALKGLHYKIPHDVDKILFSGEVMPVKQLRQWQIALPKAKFVNLYGPSEITCNCTYHTVEKIYQDGEQIPIGRPFAGREVFLLDEQGEVTKPSQIGEICVIGESLSDGYYRNPEETRKRFIDFPQRGNKAGYKTGDLGYYGIDGELYFAGRKDFQIKHMGHRIELEGIQQKMEQIDGIERCLCLMDEKKNRIVAFYLGEKQPEEIRVQLKKNLPTYMIPQKIMKTDIVPLTKNGKTDRQYFKQIMEGMK